MTLIIVTILLLGFLLIATESLTKVNKAAVAMFAGTVGWVLYICWGADFVANMHANEYSNFLSGADSTSVLVKQFIAQNIFLKYVGKAAEIVLFLLATMNIVEILNNNGCFDFVSQLLRTRNSSKMLWVLSAVTFIISANLDNFTTTMMMLTIMHNIIPNRRQRMIYGAAVVISANVGGAITVIGSPIGLVLWNIGAVTATNYSLSLTIPCLIAWALPIWLLGRSLPERVDSEWVSMPYRGDDTNLNTWQRLLMLFVGIGGLWFIPSFHNITKLSPFLGALCVLSVLWVVNEIFNRKLMNSDQMIQRRMPRVLQYGVIQMMLFVMGLMLAVGVVNETGAINALSSYIDNNINNIYIVGLITGATSTFLDNFATALSVFSLHQVDSMTSSIQSISPYVQNGSYWKLMSYVVVAGGNVMLIGSTSGLALMKTERMHIGWYFQQVGWKALLGGAVGFAVMWLISMF